MSLVCLATCAASSTEARERAAVAVNRELTLLYWNIGNRIRTDVLREERAAYGEQIISTLSRQLTREFGRGCTKDNLVRMMQFAEPYPGSKNVGTVSQQLSWSHFVAIELKLEKFTAAHKVQMERYLRWLNRYERRKQDEAPIGLILCSERSPQQIESLELDNSDIRVAEYFTKRLPTPLLDQELQKALRRARERLTLPQQKQEKGDTVEKREPE